MKLTKILRAMEVLKATADFKHDPETGNLGTLKAEAFCAWSSLMADLEVAGIDIKVKEVE